MLWMTPSQIARVHCYGQSLETYTMGSLPEVARNQDLHLHHWFYVRAVSYLVYMGLSIPLERPSQEKVVQRTLVKA